MFKYLKNISIVVISLFVFLFLFMWIISVGIDENIDNDFISNDKSINKLKQKHVELSKAIIKDLTSEFTIPPVKTVPVVATVNYTKPKKSKISLKDKACNDAIFKAMSDKSKDAQANKKRLCVHNIH
ncbi:MAG: hypothetical protein OCD00_02060 [Colwellia sp.]